MFLIYVENYVSYFLQSIKLKYKRIESNVIHAIFKLEAFA